MDSLSIYIIHYISMEDFNYTVFKVFDGMIVYTVHVISRDIRLRSRTWFTPGVMIFAPVFLLFLIIISNNMLGFAVHLS